jgi:hypothetical protein
MTANRFVRFNRRLDHAVWRIGERVPAWWMLLPPLLVMSIDPAHPAVQTAALFVGVASGVITWAHATMEHRIKTTVDALTNQTSAE